MTDENLLTADEARKLMPRPKVWTLQEVLAEIKRCAEGGGPGIDYQGRREQDFAPGVLYDLIRLGYAITRPTDVLRGVGIKITWSPFEVTSG